MTINAGGDAVDSNGYVEVTGGELVGASSGAGDSALDYEYGATVTGGTVILAGGAGMAETFSEGSTQPFALVMVAGNEGDALVVTGSAGAELVAWRASESFQCVLVSIPGMQEGETCTLTVNDAATEFTASTTPSNTMGGARGAERGGRPDNL